MSVMDMNSRMAMAEKLSVQQLQQAIQSGSLPAYIGIPLIEQKNKEKSQMAAAQQGQQKPPSVAASILQQAEQGVTQLPSNLPEQGMAGGGIVAFAEGGDADDFDVEAYREQEAEDEYAGSLSALIAAAQAAAEEGVSTKKKGKKYADGGIARLNDGGAIRFQSRGLVEDDLKRMRVEDPEGYARIMREIPVAPASHATYVEPRLSMEQQAGMNDPMVDIGMMRGTPDAGMPSTVPTLSPVVVTPANASPERSAPLQPQKFPDEFPEEAASPSAGIDKLPAAKTANSTVPGAPQGNVSPMSQGADQAGKPRSAYDDFLDEIKAGREDLKTKAEKDKYMAMIAAGLGMMSGTSPNAFANIGQGAQAGVASYMASGKQRAAEKAALNKNLLMGRRYQSMEDVANRTADINERRYAAIAAARGAGAGSSLREEEQDRKRLNDLQNGLQRLEKTETDRIKEQFNPMIYPKEYAAAMSKLRNDPKLLRYNAQINSLFDKMYGAAEAPAPTGNSGGSRIRVDQAGNIIP
jgi:hypothetical protein